MVDEHAQADGHGAIYDEGAHWPNIERRRPGYERRTNSLDANLSKIAQRCEFCERSLRVVSAVIAVMMLLLLGLGVWAWNLQENVWRELLKNREVIYQARDQISKENLNILNSIELSRVISEKNQQILVQNNSLLSQAQKKP